MSNKVRELRKRAGVPRQALAQKVSISNVELHRIESNKHPVPIPVANAICAEIAAPLETAFPGTKKAYAAYKKEMDAPDRGVSDATYRHLREVGLEGDTRKYTLKLMLRDQQSQFFFPFLPSEFDRLFSAAQGEDSDESEVSFIVFDSDNCRVAINLHAAVFCQFLWDADIGKSMAVEAVAAVSGDNSNHSLQVYLSTIRAPVFIAVEGEDGTDLDNEHNHVSYAFFRLDSGGMQAHERIHIVDEDGENIFLRAGDIALLTAPLWVLDSSELDGMCPDDEED